MNILICDLNISRSGHNASYAQYIVDNLTVNSGEQISFFFNSTARIMIDISKSMVAEEHFIFTQRDFIQDNLVGRLKFREWNLIKSLAAELGIDHLFILDLTRYEIQISRSTLPYKISGIEFRPSHRIRASNGSFPIRLQAKLQRLKRIFFESILLRSKSLTNVFILNDETGVNQLNRRYHTGVFKHLVDPVFDYNKLNNDAIVKLPKINKNKVKLLLFGAMDWRKNIQNIFNALSLLDPSMHPTICLLIIGKVPEYYLNEFHIMLTEFQSRSPLIEVIVVNDFVSNNHMEYYFEISDISLLVYAKFYGSSGLVGRAAKYGIISLVSNVGLMAEMCVNYRLGYVCDPNSPVDIKEKILLAFSDVQKKIKIDGFKFISDHSPLRFLHLLGFSNQTSID